jgi:ATP-dependent Clp protease ATP-binding subunit ClpA
MFERFTDRARRVVVLAQEEARLLSHNYIGTEHILLGLIHENDGVAAKVLEGLGISLEAVRAKVEAIIGEGGPGAPAGHIPFTPRAKKVLELSLREALQLGHNYIGTEHILLGLIREGQGVGAQVLVNLGAELSAVREAVVSQLSGFRVGLPGGVRMHPASGQRPRETPAAAKAAVEARRLAGGGAVGSQHYLLGLLREEDSMAAKALADLGVSREAIEAKLAELEPAGTSDETPEQAGARRIGLRVEGRLLMLEIDDPELAASLEKAMVGRKVRIIKGTDPEAEAAGFPNVWSAVSRTVDDLTRRLGRVTSRTPGAASTVSAYWRPPGWDTAAHAAGYWVVNLADGPSAYLEVGPGVDREAVRAWLAGWLREWRRSGLVRPGGPQVERACATLWLAVDAIGDSFTIGGYGLGATGPPASEPVPFETLVDAAIENLSVPL